MFPLLYICIIKFYQTIKAWCHTWCERGVNHRKLIVLCERTLSLIGGRDIRVHLHQASASMLQQLCDRTTDNALIISQWKECIPVGCVLPTRYSMGGLHDRYPSPDRDPPGQRPPRMGTPQDSSEQRPRLLWTETKTPLWNRITDACENITFPQLRLRVVTMESLKKVATPIWSDCFHCFQWERYH